MALDGIILSKVKDDLCSKLPIRINRISETSKTEIVFNIHADGVRSNLVMSFHSVYNHISLSDKNFATHNDPSTFVMVLRKHLINGIIYKIDQNEYDRYLLLHIKALDEIYDEKDYVLSLELMGKYANLILVDSKTNKIIDALKKIPPYENTRRTILQGSVFTLPEKQEKINFFNINNIDLDDSLVKQYQGFSKVLENEVRYRLNNNESLEEIKKDLQESHSLYLSEIDNGYEYHIIPLTYLNIAYEKHSLHEGFDCLYYGLDEKERIKNITDDIYKYVKKQLKHFEVKVDKISNSLTEAKNLEDDRLNGDYLYTYGNLELKGLKEITILDKTIRLEPKYSIKDNARRYYNIYQKKRKGQIHISEQLELAKNEYEYFKSLYEQLSLANFDDAMDIKEELYKYGYLKNKQRKQTKKKLNLYQVKIQGYTITFGKNNLQNNHLTFDYAHKDYMWFHAKDYHGAHVCVDSENPEEDIIRLCANIAAYFSSGRFSSSVPIDYCLVRNIKKIPGAKMGFVSYKNQKTIYIDPEEIKLPINSI